MSKFLAIADEIKARIEAISVAGGANLDLGDAVYVNGMQPIPSADDQGNLLEGSVVVDPGDITVPDDEGTTRAGTVVLDSLLDRTITIVTAWPCPDKSQWLILSEQIGEDIRGALYAQPVNINDSSVTDWRALGVKRINQISQSASWPQSGSRVLHVETQFRIRYSEN